MNERRVRDYQVLDPKLDVLSSPPTNWFVDNTAEVRRLQVLLDLVAEISVQFNMHRWRTKQRTHRDDITISNIPKDHLGPTQELGKRPIRILLRHPGRNLILSLHAHVDLDVLRHEPFRNNLDRDVAGVPVIQICLRARDFTVAALSN